MIDTDIGRLPDDEAVVGERGVSAIGGPGRAALELSAGLPPAAVSPPDHVLSESVTADLQIRAASLRGLLHRYRNQPRQDEFSIVHDPASDLTVVVVCDGVGSLARSHEAAAYVAHWLPGQYLYHREWGTALAAVNDDLIRLAAQPLPWAPPADGPYQPEMATTVVAVAVSPSPGGRVARITWTDDSTVWHLSPEGAWTLLTPQPVTDDGTVITGSVRALPAAQPRFHVRDVAFPDGALLVMTDGVGLPLASSAEVRRTLAEWWAQVPDIFTFARQVGFARKTHTDDRTVVGLWVTDRRSEVTSNDELGGQEDSGAAPPEQSAADPGD